MTKNFIAFNKGFVCLTPVYKSIADSPYSQLVMSIQEELMTNGYILDEKALEALLLADGEDIVDFHADIMFYLKEYLGEGYRSLYGDFPNDVMSLSESMLKMGNIIHYITGELISLGDQKKTTNHNAKDEEKIKYKVITSCDEKTFVQKCFTDLCLANNSLTPNDQRTLQWFSQNYEELLPVPNADEIPFKENLAILAINVSNFRVKTVIDVLRVAVGLSGGDVSLKPVPKRNKYRVRPDLFEAFKESFKFKLNATQRKKVLELFERSNLNLSDMKAKSKYQRFIRLGEVLKVNKYQKQFPKTVAAFDRLRNQKRKGKPEGQPVIRTWNYAVQQSFKESLEAGLDKLCERPSEFVRRLDSLIRNNSDDASVNLILSKLKSCFAGISNKVIYESYSHFFKRTSEKARKIKLPNGRLPINLPTLKPLPESTVNLILESLVNILQSKIATLEPMGKVWISEDLKDCPLPVGMRNTSDSLVSFIPGQKIQLDVKDNFLRAFLRWEDEMGTMDLDLSGILFCKKTKDRVVINFREPKYLDTIHSGDVRHVQGKCEEYIDFNINQLLDKGFDHVLIFATNYSGTSLAETGATAGFMSLKRQKNQHSFIPTEVEQSFKLDSPNRTTLLGILFLIDRKFKFIDLDYHGQVVTGNMDIEQNLDFPPITVYDLLKYHAELRGELVTDKEDADVIFDNDFVKSYLNIYQYMGV